MSEIEKIDTFIEKYKSFHEDLVDFKKSIDVSVEQDNKLFNDILNYLNELKQVVTTKESENNESTDRE